MPRAATHAARAAIGEAGAARPSRKAGPRAKVGARSASARAAPAKRRAPAPRGAQRSVPARRGTARSRTAVPHRRARSPRRAPGAVVLRLPVRSAGGLVDRLLRGRLWVGFIGALLAGIVFLNVSLLGINGGIAATSDQAAELRRQNAELRLDVAKLGSSERIRRAAEAQGFVMPAPGDVTYLEPDPEADGRRAALALEKAAADGETAVAPLPESTAAPVAEEAPASLAPEQVAAAPPAVATDTAAPPAEPAPVP